MQETTFPEGNDPSKMPEKAVVEAEKKLLVSFSRILIAFLNGHLDLQLIAIYALQVYCFQYKYPKGEWDLLAVTNKLFSLLMYYCDYCRFTLEMVHCIV